ncbi:MAG: hypothetical protein Q4F79_12435 [Eubacteriales bacterium]|nr:hypothetical protein [Eubacteriales bacterium]
MNIEVGGKVSIEVTIPQLTDICCLLQGLQKPKLPEGKPITLQQLYAIHEAQQSLEKEKRVESGKVEQEERTPEPDIPTSNIETAVTTVAPTAELKEETSDAPVADHVITHEEFRTHLIESRRAAAKQGLDILTNAELRDKIKGYGCEKINDLPQDALNALYAWIDQEVASRA